MEEQNINNDEGGKESEVRDEKEELSKCRKERDEYLEGWKRAKADLVNYKRDEEKRFEALVKFGHEAMIRDLLTTLDSLDLAIVSVASAGKDAQGFYLIRAQLEDILKKHGLEKMKVSAGDQFDPAIHDAISVEESEKPGNTIIEEVEKGYILNGRIIRAAKVKVAK